ncbi:GtrA family protein [Tsuneonella amylolytica]|uniref:GtrA family protein n=1 Tax=Tsuneonella amylolytica TaxID=2338327 RepID=UPI000EAA756A|nr:GtrA family protein [Tsuneonella amylolytica]
MIATLTRFADVRLVRYALASVGALAIDMGSFLALLALAVPAAGASAIGYIVGIGAHWMLSSRAVFVGRVAANGAARHRQKALFVGSALVGLAITTAIVGAGVRAGMDPRVAKLAAIAVSFAITWILRSRVVFRNPAGAR